MLIDQKTTTFSIVVQIFLVDTDLKLIFWNMNFYYIYIQISAFFIILIYIYSMKTNTFLAICIFYLEREWIVAFKILLHKIQLPCHWTQKINCRVSTRHKATLLCGRILTKKLHDTNHMTKLIKEFFTGAQIKTMKWHHRVLNFVRMESSS